MSHKTLYLFGTSALGMFRRCKITPLKYFIDGALSSVKVMAIAMSRWTSVGFIFSVLSTIIRGKILLGTLYRSIIIKRRENKNKIQELLLKK